MFRLKLKNLGGDGVMGRGLGVWREDDLGEGIKGAFRGLSGDNCRLGCGI